MQCKSKPNVWKPMIGDVRDLCNSGDKKLEKLATKILKATTGETPTTKEMKIQPTKTESSPKEPLKTEHNENSHLDNERLVTVAMCDISGVLIEAQ